MPPVSIRPTQRRSALRLSSLPAIAALASAVAGTSLAANAPQIGVPQASAAQTGTPQTSATPVAGPQSGGAAELQKAVRDSVLAARARLGELQPWQQQLFSGEVLPQAEKFIREYRRQGTGFRVEVDEGLLRDYLAYFAPASLALEDPQFLVRVEAEPGCVSCGEALPSLRQVLESRISSRGIRAVLVKDSEMPPRSLLFRRTPEFPSLALVKILQDRKLLQGAVVLRIERAVRRDDESGMELHPEDSKLRLVFGFSAGRITEIRQLEFQATDSTELSSRRLLVEAFGSIGSRARELGAAGAPREELDDTAPMLRITGLRDYTVLAELKARVTEILGANGIALERRLGRGVCVLALHTRLPAAELRAKLEGLRAGGRRILIREAARDAENRMEWEAAIQ